MKISISIADDHPMVITGIQNMLSDCGHIHLLSFYPDGTSLLTGLQNETPDVLILDIQMPGKSGDQLAPIILKKYPELRILALTNFESTLYARTMMRNGVLGYLLKTTDRATLITAIETVYEGKEFLTPPMRERIEQSSVRENKAATSKSHLSPREKQILQLIINGGTSQEIASQIFISQGTVENYRLSIMLKLDVKNTATLVKKALQLGLAD